MRVGPRWPRVGRSVERLTTPLYTTVHRLNQSHTLQSRYAQERLASLREKIGRKERVLLAGISPVSHNTGVSLVEIDPRGRISMHANDEEERYASIKHCRDYPTRTIEVLRRRVCNLGIAPRDIHAWLGTWNYPAMTVRVNLLAGTPGRRRRRGHRPAEAAFWDQTSVCAHAVGYARLPGCQPQPVISPARQPCRPRVALSIQRCRYVRYGHCV